MRPNRYCECGQLAGPPVPGTGQRICGRCAWLDGHGTTEYALIAALRRSEGYLDVHQIAASSGYNERSVYRVIPKLIARGRVQVQVDPNLSSHRSNGHRRPLYRLVS